MGCKPPAWADSGAIGPAGGASDTGMRGPGPRGVLAASRREGRAGRLADHQFRGEGDPSRLGRAPDRAQQSAESLLAERSQVLAHRAERRSKLRYARRVIETNDRHVFRHAQARLCEAPQRADGGVIVGDKHSRRQRPGARRQILGQLAAAGRLPRSTQQRPRPQPLTFERPAPTALAALRVEFDFGASEVGDHLMTQVRQGAHGQPRAQILIEIHAREA